MQSMRMAHQGGVVAAPAANNSSGTPTIDRKRGRAEADQLYSSPAEEPQGWNNNEVAMKNDMVMEAPALLSRGDGGPGQQEQAVPRPIVNSTLQPFDMLARSGLKGFWHFPQ